MKHFIKIILNGLKVLLISLVCVISTGSGVLVMTKLSEFIGFKAVYMFFCGVIALFLGGLVLYILGHIYDTSEVEP